MNNSIWVVDDDPIFRLIFAMTVKKLNGSYLIKEHENGAEACAKIDELFKLTAQFPRCLFMDINMPGMNGWECLDKIRKLLSNYQGTLPKIYIISSSINPEDKKRALSFECTTGYLTKPIAIDTLQKIMGE